MSDRVFIRELRVPTVIGVYGWEREVRQTLLLDLELATAIAGPATDDDLRAALDYDALCRRVREFGAANRFQLIETFAERLAALLREEYAIPWLRLRLCKPGAVDGTRDVGVLIERGTRP
jgi:dihydroneopterin aldolase